MSKFEKNTKTNGPSAQFEDNDILSRLLETDSAENVYKKINSKYPNYFLYEQAVLDIEAVIEKYYKKVMK